MEYAFLPVNPLVTTLRDLWFNQKKRFSTAAVAIVAIF
jgi:hypothetical protein